MKALHRLRRHFFWIFWAGLMGLSCLNPAWAKKTAASRPAAPTPPAITIQAADPASLPEQPEKDACALPGENLAPTMVLIPPGQFLMGSPAAEKDRLNTEGPRHWAAIPRPFAISRCEITKGQFRQFVNDRLKTDHKPYKTVAENTGGCYVYDPKAKQWGRDKTAYWDKPGFPQDDNHPVVCIAWQDAKDYADWLSRRTGANYRLPSEAEWEYAARAGTLTSRFWGDDPEQGCGFANGADAEAAKINPDWKTTRCSDHYGYTAPVATFRPNPFGVYDMAGNAWEWVEDCDHDNYQGAPDDGRAWIDSTKCATGYRGLRGGSWNDSPQYLRSANRDWLRPDGANDYLGFRLARAW